MQILSDKLVNPGYTSFAVEDLHIQNMVRNHNLAQSIYDASWNRFIQMLSYKAESAGLRIIKVDARNTSKECSNCGIIQAMPLSIREYNCSRCGMQMNRDINASINILTTELPSDRGEATLRERMQDLDRRQSSRNREPIKHILCGMQRA
ncbi:transposase [Candidatus Marsarchaeota archaeon]|nr:transposase [Candidatus Marsarchaeota archaeon]